MALASLIKFLSVTIFAVAVLIMVTLLWPRFTYQPRPSVLQKVHEIVIGTNAGADAADVLGVSIEAEIEPINIAELGMQALVGAGNAVKDNITGTIMKVTIGQITKQFMNLPDKEKQDVRAAICVPVATQ